MNTPAEIDEWVVPQAAVAALEEMQRLRKEVLLQPGTPQPYTLHNASCTEPPAPCTLHPAHCTLHPEPCILRPNS